MDHVNNAVYADWVDEAITRGRRRDAAVRRDPAARPARVRPGGRARRTVDADAGRMGRLVVPALRSTEATCFARDSSRSSIDSTEEPRE